MPKRLDELSTFTHLGGWPSQGSTAWDLAWMKLRSTVGENPANVWLVEEEVAGNETEFSRLFKSTTEVDADLSCRDLASRAEDPHWPFWNQAALFFPYPCRSFNPICRLSSRLVSVVLEFQRQHRQFAFHETLFASLVAEHGFSFLDWSKDVETRVLFGPFRQTEEISSEESSICFPVRNDVLHARICSSN